ncbi:MULTISPECIES: TIGR03862 family flavoprotein [unclassified Undibacterium]|uniref:TIGR03862 family flavoprotein n=1 Tax=unclassified Undibacterium TaxID=2630295 RepID=UPI002AC8F807|nr:MULTISPECIES: TIGR03862 family flavoprotein [unclassified Undibacterium]MEB0138917.1 TIGR03862 family flavoprotein [Undibacterium sp. CCC2.1]MEB0171752.1 TIGR03862 family flavoprotein [Undibacterium sp. CCC1.1]MEB0175548.1 TIGR03862 family flavoprotein [Undibacterium sp. CCC3.4]MEB0214954.1 TIGR03862 family flavoprotein [Undibacterium sp. 5I2]WPX44936.1 TIGR03862 family flavoprotein [Undibacterium sp. CCC3.4]
MSSAHHSSFPRSEPHRVIVIGGGPAGLMAAEVLAAAGVAVDVYDAMASVGRKFLLAGKGGMNLTHGEAWPAFIGRYGARAAALHDIIKDFDPSALRAWALALGVETFVGSSGRVFPVDMKAAPLLRAWLHALRSDQVRFHMRHRWTGAGAAGQGWEFTSTNGPVHAQADAVVLALGGGSWARLGSDGAWVPWLQQRGVEVSPLVAANCGFDTVWTPFFQQNFAGQPVLTVAARTAAGAAPMRQGQFVITEGGVEGSLIYALSSALRQQLVQNGYAVLELDLLPDKSAERLAAELVSGRGARSLSTHLRSKLGLDRLKIALLHEVLTPEQMRIPAVLAQTIKALPLRLHATRPLDEAISSAGGVCFEALDETLMLRACPGVFCAGEMLDWEAPTGGYLLTASMASGRQAARGVLNWLHINKKASSLPTE